MDKRTLRVDKEHVGNPNLLHKTCIEGTTLVAARGEGKAVVLPVMPQVQSHGEVLEDRRKQNTGAQAQQNKGDTVWWLDHRNPSSTYHIYFRYAVNAFHLDVNANGNSWTCKRPNLVIHRLYATAGSHPPWIICLPICQRLYMCKSHWWAIRHKPHPTHDRDKKLDEKDDPDIMLILKNDSA